MTLNPADDMFWLKQLRAELDDARSRIAALEGRGFLDAQTATVTVTGGVTCTVQFASGTTKVVPYMSSYTPTGGDKVLVVSGPRGSYVIGRAST